MNTQKSNLSYFHFPQFFIPESKKKFAQKFSNEVNKLDPPVGLDFKFRILVVLNTCTFVIFQK